MFSSTYDLTTGSHFMYLYPKKLKLFMLNILASIKSKSTVSSENETYADYKIGRERLNEPCYKEYIAFLNTNKFSSRSNTLLEIKSSITL